eukprot:g64777.t1
MEAVFDKRISVAELLQVLRERDYYFMQTRVEKATDPELIFLVFFVLILDVFIAYRETSNVFGGSNKQDLPPFYFFALNKPRATFSHRYVCEAAYSLLRSHLESLMRGRAHAKQMHQLRAMASLHNYSIGGDQENSSLKLLLLAVHLHFCCVRVDRLAV